jgi:hypothetical protein
MISANQIRNVVALFLVDNDADAFVLKFGELSHNIHLLGDAAAIELSRKIESRLNDVRLSCISKADFRKELCKLFVPSYSQAVKPLVIDCSWYYFHAASSGQVSAPSTKVSIGSNPVPTKSDDPIVYPLSA